MDVAKELATTIRLLEIAIRAFDDSSQKYRGLLHQRLLGIRERMDCMLRPCTVDTAFCDMVDITALLLSVEESKELKEDMEICLIAELGDRAYVKELKLDPTELVSDLALRQATAKSISMERAQSKKFAPDKPLVATEVCKAVRIRAAQVLTGRACKEVGEEDVDDVYEYCDFLLKEKQ